eukprot:TRINITY_DN2034_c0_g3_i3.p1 TRINITY_DN2034_c0_g3~~TRINITY_DN2034_c0_g3_i3.p1  ORF type:complete len:734 (-),score=140.48 TRINITY_DN2034_c0_g3_i3:35-2236(-)
MGNICNYYEPSLETQDRRGNKKKEEEKDQTSPEILSPSSPTFFFRGDGEPSEDHILGSDTKGRPQRKGQIRIKRDILARNKIIENIRHLRREKSTMDILFMVTNLRKHFVFYNLSDNELQNFVPRMFYCEVEEGEFIFKQGENATTFFLLAAGSMEVMIDGKFKKKVVPGDLFGEYALLFDAPRSASLRALEHCYLWGIDRQSFKASIAEIVTKEFRENRAFIDDIKIFEHMTPNQKDVIANNVITQRFEPGATIINEGDQASSFYIIKDGTVVVLKGEEETRRLQSKETFGEQALYFKTVRQRSVKALDKVTLLAIGADTVRNVLGNEIQEIAYRNLKLWAIERQPTLSRLSRIQIEKLLENLKAVQVAKDSIVVEANLPLDQMYVVLKGSLRTASGREVAATGGLLGESCIISGEMMRWDENIIAAEETVLAGLTSNRFQEALGDIHKLIENHEKHRARVSKARQLTIARVAQASSEVTLDSLILIKKLGAGHFGNVYLVYASVNQNLYAIKCISKEQTVEDGMERHVVEERNVLKRLIFPFVITTIRTFKDAKFVYFLVEYVKGNELFDVIREIGLLATYDSQFYVASMFLAIEYLHSQGIIYRDLKPENVMVDDQGYLKLIDMGTAKVLDVANARSFTIIGTPHYMAPEILQGKGYSNTVDLWSLGICLYEFLCGYVPFGETAEDPLEIYKEITKSSLTFPDYLTDLNARHMIGPVSYTHLTLPTIYSV